MCRLARSHSNKAWLLPYNNVALGNPLSLRARNGPFSAILLWETLLILWRLVTRLVKNFPFYAILRSGPILSISKASRTWPLPWQTIHIISSRVVQRILIHMMHDGMLFILLKSIFTIEMLHWFSYRYCK